MNTFNFIRIRHDLWDLVSMLFCSYNEYYSQPKKESEWGTTWFTWWSQMIQLKASNDFFSSACKSSWSLGGSISCIKPFYHCAMDDLRSKLVRLDYYINIPLKYDTLVKTSIAITITTWSYILNAWLNQNTGENWWFLYTL